MYSTTESTSSLGDTIAIPMGSGRVDPAVCYLPMAAARAALGFPSPAEDFQEDSLDLNELLVRNPAATFLYRAEGSSMIEAGICGGDILIVDRSVTPRHGDVVIASWEGNAPACKVLHVLPDHIELHSRNSRVLPIVLGAMIEVEVFAVVGVARQMRRVQGQGRRAGR